ncbi:hypothetical protein GMRT_15278 [Giardia muris]|uniref:Uncharacterized protein n=1 Tax=Giardia muris TaxID=5742 RepID=A0A4Z1SQ01_GIAMU|nr:hypothetical protein GMRT_15278 [Giardia muris]|eukprot:TNJ27886.1 hypothetical protein GMRT_15278 [Giardia muris]
MQPERWRADLPERVQDQLDGIESRLREVSDVAQRVREAVATCPTRSEILPLLDHKLDVAQGNRLVIELHDLSDELRGGLEQLQTSIFSSLDTLRNETHLLEESSQMIQRFEETRKQVQADTSSLLEELAATRKEAWETVDLIRKDHSEVKEMVEGAQKGALEVQEHIQTLEARQMASADAFDDLKKKFQADYDSLSESIRTIRSSLDTITTEMPRLTAQAQVIAERNVMRIVEKEAEAHRAEVAGIKELLETSRSTLGGLEKTQNSIHESFQITKSNILAEINQVIQETAEGLNSHIDDTLKDFRALKTRLNESIVEQRSTVSQLEQFTRMFDDADRLWKEHLDSIRTELQASFDGFKTSLLGDVATVKHAISVSEDQTRETQRILREATEQWDKEWIPRERTVDETLLRIQKVLYEVDEAIANETSARTADMSSLQDTVERGLLTLRRQLDGKADMEDVRRALWAKVDRTDV